MPILYVLLALVVGIYVGYVIGYKHTRNIANTPESTSVTDDDYDDDDVISTLNSLSGKGSYVGGVVSQHCVLYPILLKSNSALHNHEHTDSKVCNANVNELMHSINHDFWIKVFKHEEALVRATFKFGWNSKNSSLLENVVRYVAIRRFMTEEVSYDDLPPPTTRIFCGSKCEI